MGTKPGERINTKAPPPKPDSTFWRKQFTDFWISAFGLNIVYEGPDINQSAFIISYCSASGFSGIPVLLPLRAVLCGERPSSACRRVHERSGTESDRWHCH